MQIDKVNIHPVLLPFTDEFSHSLRKRTSAKNVIAEVVADKGKIIGYGEGAPRSYVTGESQESTIRSIHRFTQKENFPWNLNDVSQIWNFIDTLPSGKGHNSAICATETALLDALAKSHSKSIIEYFPQDFLTDTVFYSATFPLTHKQRILKICLLCKKMKINKLRIKAGKDFTQNKEILEVISSVFGDDYDLRVDLNGSWNRELAFNHIHLFRKYKVKILEQPMMPDDPDLADFADAMQSSGVILMADESACSLQDVKKISQEGYYGMINVRLSKCGGFRRSLELIEYLRTKGIRFQIAGHLGESGILSAAGRALCLLCGDAVYYDGSYDEFLLKENITHENVSFGLGGKAGPLTGPGLGVEVNRQNLARLGEIPESMTRPATLKHDLLHQNKQ